jgi:hypothetical protein
VLRQRSEEDRTLRGHGQVDAIDHLSPPVTKLDGGK